MQTLRATRTWPYREAQALTALARSRLSASAEGLALLTKRNADSDCACLQPPGQVDQAGLAAIRAELLHAAGRPLDAAAALKDLSANLNGQHPDNPRSAAARLLASTLDV